MSHSSELKRLLVALDLSLEGPVVTLEGIYDQAGPAMLAWHLASPVWGPDQAAYFQELYDHPLWQEITSRFGDQVAGPEGRA